MKNLIARTLSGLLFLVIMVGCILWNAYAFLALTCIIVILGMNEFFKMFFQKPHKIQQFLSIFSGICIVAWAFLFQNIYYIEDDIFDKSELIEILLFLLNGFLILLPIIATIIIFVLELYKKSEKPFENLSLFFIPIFYIVIPFALIQLCNDVPSNRHNFFILAFFILIWANDVGAYCFGMLLGQNGKHKLFPRISPKKSWEGFIGGIITAVVASILVSKFMFYSENMHHWIIIAIITSVFGTFGDLVESMLKRSVGVKDSGKIIPGHGGILDRFDAVLLSFPIVFVYMATFIL
ncbi:MAG: phosphatidate cytidylyltransferase [Prevotellaceae bacterium]|jgi:phosphatidate cytidylyltransferase|nr:phosphatidate cytidylyltransferase [Prevotellaceae bacterium]